MPIYEYRCSACGFEKDALRKLSDPPLVDCPQCGKPALVKLISAAGFQLKGSGWYATDFKGSGTKAKTDSSDAGKPTSGESTAPASGDAKSEKASEKASTTPAESSKPATSPAPGG
jgi:putative FmdB family regulatory protein